MPESASASPTSAELTTRAFDDDGVLRATAIPPCADALAPLVGAGPTHFVAPRTGPADEVLAEAMDISRTAAMGMLRLGAVYTCPQVPDRPGEQAPPRRGETPADRRARAPRRLELEAIGGWEKTLRGEHGNGALQSMRRGDDANDTGTRGAQGLGEDLSGPSTGPGDPAAPPAVRNTPRPEGSSLDAIASPGLSRATSDPRDSPPWIVPSLHDGHYVRAHGIPKRFPASWPLPQWRGRVRPLFGGLAVALKPAGVPSAPTVDNSLECLPGLAAVGLALQTRDEAAQGCRDGGSEAVSSEASARSVALGPASAVPPVLECALPMRLHLAPLHRLDQCTEGLVLLSLPGSDVGLLRKTLGLQRDEPRPIGVGALRALLRERGEQGEPGEPRNRADAGSHAAGSGPLPPPSPPPLPPPFELVAPFPPYVPRAPPPALGMTKYYRALTRFPPPLGEVRHGLVVEHRLEGLPGHTLALDGWEPEERRAGGGEGARLAVPRATKPPESYRKQWRLLQQLGVLPPSAIDPVLPGGMGPGWERAGKRAREGEGEGEAEGQGGEKGAAGEVSGALSKGASRERLLSERAKESLLVVRHVWPLVFPTPGLSNAHPSAPANSSTAHSSTPANSSNAHSSTTAISAPYYEVLIELKTGRTHQIRAQLSALGCPLVADSLYEPLADPGFRQLLLREGDQWRKSVEQRIAGSDDPMPDRRGDDGPRSTLGALGTEGQPEDHSRYLTTRTRLDSESSGPNHVSKTVSPPAALSASTLRLLRSTLAPDSSRRPLEPPEAVGLQAARVDVRGEFGGTPRHVSLRAGVPPWRRGRAADSDSGGQGGGEGEGAGVPRGLERAGEGWGEGEAPWEGEVAWLGEAE